MMSSEAASAAGTSERDPHALYRAGQYQAAADICEQELVHTPNNLAVLLLASACYFVQRNFEKR
jgi:hypothetical protein